MRKLVAERLHDLSAQHLIAASLLITSLRMDQKRHEDIYKWDELERMMSMAMNELRLIMKELQ